MTDLEPTAGGGVRVSDNVAPTQNVDLATPQVPYEIADDSTVAAGLEVKTRSQWDYARRRFFRHRLAMLGLIGLIIIFGAGIFAGHVAQYSFEEIDLNNILRPPTTVDHHWFGNVTIGRDYFSRVVFRIRT